MRRHELADQEWAKIEPLCSGKKTDSGATAKDNRLFVNAVVYRYKTGIPWRDLPERFGDYRVIHVRLTRWAQKGIWAKIFNELKVDADLEMAMIDSTVVRAHQHSSSSKKKT